MSLLTPNDVLYELARECRLTSQKTIAKRLGFSSAYICDVLKGRREISEQLAEKLGYNRVIRFSVKGASR